MKFNKTPPSYSGMYLAVVILEGDKIVIEASYDARSDNWTVDPVPFTGTQWNPIPVKMVAWTDDFPFGDF